MKRIIYCLMMFLIVTTMFSCKKNNEVNMQVAETDNEAGKTTCDLAQGVKMPNVTLETNKGTVFELEKVNKPTLINFWATWCPPCRVEMPGLQALYEEYGDKVEFVMINLGESKETVQDFLVENEIYTFPIAYDTKSEYAYKFGIDGIPTTYIVGKDKIIKNYVVGAREESQFREYLENVINN